MRNPRKMTRRDSVAGELRLKGAAKRKTLARLAELEPDPSARRNDLVPSSKIEDVPIDELVDAVRRVRKRDQVQIARLVKSIQRFGMLGGGVLINAKNEIVDGHLLVEAARLLGIAVIRCIRIEHLNEAEIRALRITLNRLAETSEWDFDALRLEIKDLSELEIDLTVTGFEDGALDMLLEDDEAEVLGQLDPLPVLQDKPVSVVGDVWHLGVHRLACGDARNSQLLASLLDSTAIRLAIIDPPYNVKIQGFVTRGEHREFPMATGEMSRETFEVFLTESLAAIEASLMPGGIVLCFMDHRSVDILYSAGKRAGLDIFNLLIWTKRNGGMGSLWRSAHELCVAMSKPGAPVCNNVNLGKDGRYRTNVLNYPGASSLGSEAREALAKHATPKALAMIADLIRDISNRGEVVVDTFCGGGTALIGAEQTGRVFRGLELDPLHVDQAIRRWQAMTGGQATLGADGPSFDSLERMPARSVNAAPLDADSLDNADDADNALRGASDTRSGDDSART